MKPTNKELNILCAKLLGYHFVDGGGLCPQSVMYITKRECPDYCSDMNLVWNIYQFMDTGNNYWEDFMNEITESKCMDMDKMDWVDAITLMRMEPRQQVISFIKATGNWNDQWDNEE